MGQRVLFAVLEMRCHLLMESCQIGRRMKLRDIVFSPVKSLTVSSSADRNFKPPVRTKSAYLDALGCA